jgi:sRNA-binding regulator protein Hfq
MKIMSEDKNNPLDNSINDKTENLVGKSLKELEEEFERELAKQQFEEKPVEKKKRGRPKKVVDEETESVKEQPKKRGRPKKVITEERTEESSITDILTDALKEVKDKDIKEDTSNIIYDGNVPDNFKIDKEIDKSKKKFVETSFEKVDINENEVFDGKENPDEYAPEVLDKINVKVKPTRDNPEIPPPFASKLFDTQTIYLHEFKEDMLLIEMMNGKRFIGRLKSYDKFTIRITDNKHEPVLIFKQGISSIKKFNPPKKDYPKNNYRNDYRDNSQKGGYQRNEYSSRNDYPSRNEYQNNNYSPRDNYSDEYYNEEYSRREQSRNDYQRNEPPRNESPRPPKGFTREVRFDNNSSRYNRNDNNPNSRMTRF